jgi:tetratricopeptide (TPR) repeat protein
MTLDGEMSSSVVAKKTHLAWTIVNQEGRVPEAEKMFREAFAAGMRLGEDSKELSDARLGLGMVLDKQEKRDEAERLFRDSIALRQNTLPADHPYLANDLYHLGVVLNRKEEAGEAEGFFRQCVAIRRKMLGVDHPDSDEAQMALVGALYAQDKGQEAADACRELLDIRRKRLGEKHPRVEQVLIHLVEILIRTQNDAGFEKLAVEFPKIWLRRSEHWARHGQWREAIKFASRFQEIDPAEHLGYYFKGMLLVQTGERAAYEELCAKITPRFAGTASPLVADRMAKVCLALPRKSADLESVGALAAAAVAADDSNPDLRSFQWGMALAEYRQGHWKEAIDWAGRAVEGPSPDGRAAACAIQAMARFQLKQTEAARATLKNGTGILETQIPKLEAGDLGPDWWDWVMVHALLAEAKKLIEG